MSMNNKKAVTIAQIKELENELSTKRTRARIRIGEYNELVLIVNIRKK